MDDDRTERTLAQSAEDVYERLVKRGCANIRSAPTAEAATSFLTMYADMTRGAREIMGLLVHPARLDALYADGYRRLANAFTQQGEPKGE